MTDVPADASAPPSDPPGASTRGNFANTVSKLTAVNLVGLLGAFVTTTVTARALGADGRGELAAILAVLTAGPYVLDLGLTQWLGRERARGRHRAELLGAALPVAFVVSLISVVVAIPLSHAIGAGRPVVVAFVQIGLFSMPLSVLLFNLAGLAVGESRWNLYAAGRLVASTMSVVVLVALAVTGMLTVGSAAAAYLLSGLFGSLVLIRTVRGVRRLTFNLRSSAAATRFGARAWLSQVGGIANSRLDQVLMAALVPSRELGLYAVAVTIASVAQGLIQGVSTALFPRVAEGDPDIAARACRVTALIVSITAIIVAVMTPSMIPFVFGQGFRAAVPMVLILLVATVPLAATIVLASALVAVNEPAATMRAELAGLAITIPALIVFLPSSGGLAAATVSVVAYSIRFAIQLAAARRAFSRPALSFLLLERADLAWLLSQARRVAPRDK